MARNGNPPEVQENLEAIMEIVDIFGDHKPEAPEVDEYKEGDPRNSQLYFAHYHNEGSYTVEKSYYLPAVRHPNGDLNPGEFSVNTLDFKESGKVIEASRLAGKVLTTAAFARDYEEELKTAERKDYLPKGAEKKDEVKVKEFKEFVNGMLFIVKHDMGLEE